MLVFKRVKHEPSDGRPPTKYTIQFLDKSLVGEAALFYIKYYCPRENLNASLDKRFAKEEARHADWITEYLSKGITLAAFLEDEEGNRGALIGLNVLFLKRDSHLNIQDTEKEDQSEAENLSERVKTILQTEAVVEAKVDVFSLYNCSSYIDDEGLVVAPAYERRGIACELLRARGEVCRMMGTPVSATVFTGEVSQKVATRCGFQTLAELDITTYRVNGQIVYPSPKWPLIKLMAKRYF